MPSGRRSYVRVTAQQGHTFSRRGLANMGEVGNCTDRQIRWRLDKLEAILKREELQEEVMAKNAEQFSDVLKIQGTTKENEVDRTIGNMGATGQDDSK